MCLFKGEAEITTSSQTGMTIAAFVIAVVAICIGVAALTISIINTVRITRMNRRILNNNHDCSNDGTPVLKSSTTTSSSSSSTRKIFHPTTKPPYYACIFTSVQNRSVPKALDGYSTLAKEMEELAKQQNGYMGIDSSSGITISYWKNNDAMIKWKNQVDHRAAQYALKKQQ